MYKFFTIAFILLVTSAGLLSAQPTILVRPRQFEKPLDYYGPREVEATHRYLMTDEMDRFINNDGPSGRETWVVYSDRAGNTLYNDADGKATGMVMTFGQPAFVVGKKGEWLELIEWDPAVIQTGTRLRKDAKIANLGWIRRDHLLLWDSALLGPESLVPRKAMLVNTDYAQAARQIIAGLKDTVDVFVSPKGEKKTKGPYIHDFFYVMKKENQRYLISRNERLFANTAENDLVGWVDFGKVSEWNTRVAIEANIHNAAFQERKDNPNFRMAHYMNREAAERHGRSGLLQLDDAGRLLVITDPVTATKNSSVEQFDFRVPRIGREPSRDISTRRFIGESLRSPVVSFDAKANVFATSVITEIAIRDRESGSKIAAMKTEDHDSAVKLGKEVIAQSDRINVMFLIEGTSAMLPYRDQILEITAHMREYFQQYDQGRNLAIKAGAVIYRDISDGPDLVEVVRPGTLSQLRNRLESIQFSSRIPTDDGYAAMYLAYQEAIESGIFTRHQVNFIIHLGNGGDISATRIRRTQDEGKRGMISEASDREEIYRQLCEFQVKILALQCRHEGGREGDSFLDDMHNLSLRSSQSETDDLRKDDQELGLLIDPVNPSMPIPLEAGLQKGGPCRLDLENATMDVRLFSPGREKYLSRSQWQEEWSFFMNRSMNLHWERMGSIQHVIADGRPVSEETPAGQLAILDLIHTELKKIVGKDYLSSLQNIRVRMMVRSFVPAQVKGMVNPLYSYVVLMNEQELALTIQRLEELNAVLNRPPSEVREALFLTLFNQYKSFLGAKSKVSRITSEEFARTVLGLGGEGVTIHVPVNFRLEDIKNDREVTEEQIRLLANSVAMNFTILRDQVRQAEYPFKFRSGRHIYYWIPVEFTL